MACVCRIKRDYDTLCEAGVMAAIRCVMTACDPAHGPVNGKGSKGPDNEALPLCRVHHAEQHRVGWPAFEARYGFSREGEAAVWWLAWKIYREGLA